MRFFIEKKEYSTKSIEHLDIVFQNGNYIKIGKDELAVLRLNLYDRLIRYEDSTCFVGHSGYVKLKISSRKGTRSAGTFFLYNPEVYKRNRKAYIESRCTVENDIDHLVFYNENNWNDMIFGDIRCHMEGEFLILRFEPNLKYGPACSDTAYIDLPDVSKKDILKIDLDFENCESVTVYESEIQDIDLTFEERLEWDGGDFCRSIKSGILSLKLKRDFSNREANLYDTEHQGTTVKRIIKRLCGKGQGLHDICHLYITYSYVGYGHLLEEKIEVQDMCLYEETPGVYNEELGEHVYDGDDDFYIGGCAKLERNGTVVVRFGACCFDDVRNIVEKEKYSVKIKAFPCNPEAAIVQPIFSPDKAKNDDVIQ